MKDVIIIGGGPAGVSTALYTARANLKTTIFTHGKSSLIGAKIENYYGFSDSNSGDELYKRGLEGAIKLGVEIIEDEVLSIKSNKDGFVVNSLNNNMEAKSIVLAIGQKKIRPRVKNIEKFEGSGVSFCAICDGFFFKGKRVGVLGSGDFALHEAEYLSNIADVILFTNGEELNSKFKTYTSKVAEVIGNDSLEEVILEDGEKVKLDGLFIALGSAGVNDFANQLGLLTSKNNFVVDKNGATNIEGVYAVGDSTGGLLQIAKAVSDGAHAGVAIIKYLRDK